MTFKYVHKLKLTNAADPEQETRDVLVREIVFPDYVPFPDVSSSPCIGIAWLTLLFVVAEGESVTFA